MSMLEEIVRLFNVLNPSEPLSRHFYGYLRVLSQVSRSFREQSMRLDMTWLLPGNVNRHRHRFPINDFTSQAVRALFGLSGPAESARMANLRLARDPPGGRAQRNGWTGITAFLNRVQFAVYSRFSHWNPYSKSPLFIRSSGLPYAWDAPRGGRGKQQRRSRQISSNDGPVVVPPPSVATLLGSGPSAGFWPVNMNGDGSSLVYNGSRLLGPSDHQNFLADFDRRMRESRERTRQGKKRKHGDQ
jgi:hypothetical protein